MANDLAYRYAERKDVPLILHFIKELAAYEKMLDEAVAGWSGGVWTGTSPALIFMFHWERNLWMSGRCIVSPVKN